MLGQQTPSKRKHPAETDEVPSLVQTKHSSVKHGGGSVMKNEEDVSLGRTMTAKKNKVVSSFELRFYCLM